MGPETITSPEFGIAQTAISEARFHPDDINIYQFSVPDFIDFISPLPGLSKEVFSVMALLGQQKLRPAWILTKNLDRLEQSVILAFAVAQKHFIFAKELIKNDIDQSIMIKLLDRIPDLTAMQIYDQLGFLKGPLSFRGDNALLLE
jgi:hypothetical protein